MDSRLASEIENVSTVPRPSLLEIQTQKSPVESITCKTGILLCLLNA